MFGKKVLWKCEPKKLNRADRLSSVKISKLLNKFKQWNNYDAIFKRALLRINLYLGCLNKNTKWKLFWQTESDIKSSSFTTNITDNE